MSYDDFDALWEEVEDLKLENQKLRNAIAALLDVPYLSCEGEEDEHFAAFDEAISNAKSLIGRVGK